MRRPFKHLIADIIKIFSGILAEMKLLTLEFCRYGRRLQEILLPFTGIRLA